MPAEAVERETSLATTFDLHDATLTLEVDLGEVFLTQVKELETCYARVMEFDVCQLI